MTAKQTDKHHFSRRHKRSQSQFLPGKLSSFKGQQITAELLVRHLTGSAVSPAPVVWSC